jgi:Tfp pilus assembly protein PilO
MAMSEKEKKQAIGGAGALPLLVALLYGFAPGSWLPFFSHQHNAIRMDEMQVRIDSLTAQVEAARKELARGSVEQLRQKVEEFRGAVRIMRRLVPEAAEVPNLIDDVSSRAKLRGVSVVQFTPLGTENGTPFQVMRYKWAVAGTFDKVGEFLSDVGGLPRIMVPYDVTVGLATAVASRVFSDTSGTVLEVGFQMRAFVKPPATPAAGQGAEQ